MADLHLAGGVIHVVAAIIWHPGEKNTFLISRRQSGKHLEHLWELPGGKKELGETRRQALCRELLEEVNTKILSTKPFIQVRHNYPDRKILLDVWEVSAFEGKVFGREGQDIRWVTIEELNINEFPDADIPVLEAIKNSVKA